MKSPRYKPFRQSAQFLLALLLLLLSSHAAADLAKDRERYAAAMKALERGNKREFLLASAQLRDYPLFPYLEYARLTRVEPELKLVEVKKFLSRWPESPLASGLRDRMLLQLAYRGDWEAFDELYVGSEAGVDLQCWKLRGELARGRAQTVFPLVAGLWLAGSSRPKACDPLFDAWIRAGHLSPELVWERLGLALRARSVGLARYLVRLLPPERQKLGNLYVRVHQMPHALDRHADFAEDSPQIREIVAHGIARRRRRDSLQAMTWWREYGERLAFSQAERREVEHKLALALASGYREGAMEVLRNADPDFEEPELLAWRLRLALNEQNWELVRTWSLRLMGVEQDEADWPYWQARALLASGSGESDRKLADSLLRGIADRRHFYGFLAAERLGLPYGLEQQPVIVSPEQLLATRHTPAVQRALELYSLKKFSAASREWRSTMRNAPEQHQWAGARIAHEWGWHYQAIMTMVRARYWDDLELRFPVVWRDLFAQHGAKHGVDFPWAIAVSRQESALLPTARSSANARGLMQLLPSTAKRVARSVGARYRRPGDLSNPALNIKLGSAYLGSLYRKYGVRAHASAAYNAGPHRVDRWLERSPDLELDAWIETIPFRETRGYVKNVLTFRIIYAHLEDMLVGKMLD